MKNLNCKICSKELSVNNTSSRCRKHKIFTEIHRKKLGDALRGIRIGEKNPKFGKRLFGKDNPMFGKFIFKTI